jgi:hypothetical protein
MQVLPLALALAGLLGMALAPGAGADDARSAARAQLWSYLEKRPLPREVLEGAGELFDVLCDREVAPERALALVKGLVGTRAGRTSAILAFAKEAKERGEALAKAVEARIEAP